MIARVEIYSEYVGIWFYLRNPFSKVNTVTHSIRQIGTSAYFWLSNFIDYVLSFIPNT